MIHKHDNYVQVYKVLTSYTSVMHSDSFNLGVLWIGYLKTRRLEIVLIKLKEPNNRYNFCWYYSIRCYIICIWRLAGKTSDRNFTIILGKINLLDENVTVIADKGFTIKNFVVVKNCQLNIPNIPHSEVVHYSSPLMKVLIPNCYLHT